MTAGALRNIIAYSVLAFPLAFAGLPLYIHAPDFYAAGQGLSLALIGTILLSIRAFDAVVDPLIGTLSDRFHKQRSLVVLLAGMIFLLSFLALFNPPAGTSTAIWFTASVAATTLSFSVLSINHNAIGSLLSDDPAQKTRITANREAFAVSGLLVAIILPSIIGDLSLYALIISAVVIACLGLFLSWLSRTPLLRPQAETSSLAKVARGMGPELRRFYIVYALSALASAIPAVLVLFFIRDLLGAENWAGLFLGVYFLAALCSMPLWHRLSQRIGDRRAWLISMLIALCGLPPAAMLGAGDVVFYALICFVTGIALGGELSLPPAMLSRLIDKNRGQADTGAYFGIYAFFIKITLALASAFALWALDGAGFVPAAANTDKALLILGVVYAIVPAVIKLPAILILSKKEIFDAQVNHNGLSGGGHGA